MTSMIEDNLGTLNRRLPSYESNTKNGLSEEYLSRRFSRTARAKQDVVYEFTRDPALLHQYFHMREEMFSSVWGLKHFNGKHDAYDDNSEILIARKGLQCVGGGRMTVSSPKKRHLLPMEQGDLSLAELFPQLDLPETTYAEFSRLAILPEFRGGAVFPEIARRFIRRAITMGVEYAFNIAPVPLARSYRQAVQLFGLQWDICHDIKVPQRDEYEGIRMIISVMDLSLQVRDYKASRKKSEAVPASNLAE